MQIHSFSYFFSDKNIQNFEICLYRWNFFGKEYAKNYPLTMGKEMQGNYPKGKRLIYMFIPALSSSTTIMGVETLGEELTTPAPFLALRDR